MEGEADSWDFGVGMPASPGELILYSYFSCSCCYYCSVYKC